jgi:hypothetical protein
MIESDPARHRTTSDPPSFHIGKVYGYKNLSIDVVVLCVQLNDNNWTSCLTLYDDNNLASVKGPGHIDHWTVGQLDEFTRIV